MLASSDLLSLNILFSRYLNQNKSTDCLFARLEGEKMYFFENQLFSLLERQEKDQSGVGKLPVRAPETEKQQLSLS